MTAAEYCFWLCLLLLAYAYFLYPLLLFLVYALEQLRRDWRYLGARHDRRAPECADAHLPSVSVVIPAYNEEERLPEKIANLRLMDYPRDRMEVIFVSDGSTDGSNAILRALDDPSIRVVFLAGRSGKSAALNHGVAQARNEILILSDAATLFEPDTVRLLVRHFREPKTGVVCGSLRFARSEESRQTEGVYWKYESMLRLMEGRVGATLTASGAVYALRRHCFPALDPATLIEDFVVPMHARRLGYEVVYDPEAVATDFAPASVEGEFARRVRIALGSFRALKELARVPMARFACVALFSHKLLRWVAAFLLIGLLASNAALWARPAYRVALAGQLAFYAWAFLGFVFRRRMQRVRYALVGYFLLAMNLAFLVGFVRFLAGREEATWQRVN